MKKYQPVHIPLRQRLAELRQGPLILCTWLLAIGTVVLLFNHRMGEIEFIGLAQPLTYEVSTPATARLGEMRVVLYQQVQAGDVIAQLDDSNLTAELQTAQAALNRIKADLEAERAKLDEKRQAAESDWQTSLRRFQDEEDRRRIDALDIKVKLESDRVEAQKLTLELDRTRKMVTAEVAPKSTLDNIQVQYDGVTRRIADNEKLLNQIEATGLDAQNRRKDFARKEPAAAMFDNQLRPMGEAIKEQEAKLAELELLRKNAILHAPAAGQITQILCRAGQAVKAGEPIAILTETRSEEIVAYVSELQSGQVKENMPVLIARVDDPTKVSQSSVLRIGPAIEQLPQRLWRTAQVPEFGRPVMIQANPALGILPGESVRIKILTPPSHTLKLPVLAFNRPSAQ